MIHLNNISKTNLRFDFDALATEDPLSLLGAVTRFNSDLVGKENEKSCLKKIDFYYYELKAKCEGLNEEDCLDILNDYFFDQKRLHINSLVAKSLEDFFIDQLIVKGYAAAMPTSILYANLASRLNIPVYFIDANTPHILKWVFNGKSNYIDLSMGGQKLQPSNLCDLLHDHPQDIREKCLEILPLKKVFEKYLHELIIFLESRRLDDLQLKCLDLALHMDNSQVALLGKRALLNKSLGHYENALSDLKRYFSFNNYANSPLNLRTAYHELEKSFEGNVDLLH